MKIKSFLTFVAFLAIQTAVFAQKGELNGAKTNYEKYVQLKDAGTAALGLSSLNSAKLSIEKASVNEKTMNLPEVWVYKAMILGDLALTDTVSLSADKTFSEAKAAFQKTVELDKEGQNKGNLDRANNLFAQYELNKGVKAYQERNYEAAFNGFNNSLTHKPGDTTLTYYAGLAAINSQNYAGAIEKYNTLLKTNFSANKEIALDLSRIYALQKDTANAIKVAGEYGTKFNNVALATQEIELSLMSGRGNQIISKISQQAEKDPKNKTYQFYLGIAYTAGKDYKQAEAAYIKAIDIDPKYEDALLNLSSTILNQGIDIYNAANKLPANKQKEYEAGVKSANVQFDRALPFLQRVVEVNPKSVSGWENLKTYYLVKRNQAKVDEINKTLSSIK
jgi:tetratricopeptide (TPR) repeat protein